MAKQDWLDGRRFDHARARYHVYDLCRKTVLAILLFGAIFYVQDRHTLPENRPVIGTTHGVQWHSCYDNDDSFSGYLLGRWSSLKSLFRSLFHKYEEPLVQCTRIDVPMTYEADDKRTISIPLVRIRANATTGVTGPPIFLNPGGPGGSGVGWALAKNLSEQAAIFGGTRDLISFDPRGVNGSRPAMSCFTNVDDRTRWYAESGGLLRSAADSVARLFASNEVMGRECARNAAEIGPYISTWYVAHDMRHMAAKIYGQSWDDVKLNYWGFSYGTALGMTYASMFPDNVGRFVIDGVADLYDYYSNEWASFLVSTDTVEAHFYESCAEHPENCALAVIESSKSSTVDTDSLDNKNNTRTAAEIKQAILGLFASLKEQPLPSETAGLVTYSSVKSYMVETLYKPDSWPELARFLNDTIHGNTTVTHEGRATADEGGMATACGDSVAPRPERTRQYIHDVTEDTERRNVLFGDYWPMKAGTRCQYYPFTSKSIFTNHSIADVKNAREAGHEVDGHARDGRGILFASLEFDVVTPLAAARAMHDEFKDSHLLVVRNGYGHCTTAMKSSCAHAVIAQWLMNGTATNTTIECDVDEGYGAFEEFSDTFQMTPIIPV